MARHKNSQQKTTELVWFRLSEPHTHAGKSCVPGDVIALRPDQVERMAALNKGEVTTNPEGEKNDI